MPEVRYFGNFQMSDISLLDRIPYSTSFQSISNQDVPADALEDAAAPEGKEADEGPKVGCVDVLHVSHRHLFSLTCAVYVTVIGLCDFRLRYYDLLKPVHVTRVAWIVATYDANPNKLES